jgi:hypothetical protein
MRRERYNVFCRRATVRLRRRRHDRAARFSASAFVSRGPDRQQRLGHYDVISNGFGVMYPYGYRVPRAITHHRLLLGVQLV